MSDVVQERDDYWEAVQLIKTNYNEDRGYIWNKGPAHKATKAESDAIFYLCTEWDHCYSRYPYDNEYE